MPFSYPGAEPVPVTRTFGGVSFEDPEAWLEDDTERVLAWQSAQNARAVAHLAALPAYDRFAGGAFASGIGEVIAPRFAGGRWFRQVIPPGQSCAVLEVCEQVSGPGRRVFDLNARESDAAASIAWFIPSPDGRAVALAWTDARRGVERFLVLDVDTGIELVDGLPQVRPNFPAWLPDGRGFYYRAHDPAVSPSRSLIYRHVLGEPPTTSPEPIEPSHDVVWPVTSADGRHVLVYADHMEPRPHFICDTATGRWRPFLRDVPGMFRGTVVGGHFVAITGEGAPRGRLVAIPLETGADRGTWRELVAASDNVLASVAAVGHRLVLVELIDTYARVRVLGLDGRVEGEIALPGRGCVGLSGSALAPIAFLDSVAVGDRREIAFVYSSLTESPTLCRADVTTLSCTPLTAPAWRLDARVSDHAATSRDGTRVPYRIVARRDTAAAGPLPTVIVVYGGFNVALLPGWPGETMAAWIDAGGALALAHVRGGGEFGPQWWRAGRLAQRHRALEDVYAVAHDLVARGTTTPRQLAIHGASHGGTLAAAVAVLRPDLFAAAVAQSPVTDLFGLVRDPITYMIARLEDGDPEDPAMSHVLREWSPLQNVVDDVHYPAMLLDCSLNDPRCPPWHGRKLAARLQRASASNRPALLRVRPTTGHAAAGEATKRSRHAETLAFLADELGLAT